MRILAVDYGEARTGLAVCDELEMLASPAGVIHQRDAQRVADEVAREATERRAALVVVGLPKNMDGSEGERAQKCTQVAEMLRTRLAVPVVLWDERSTTKTALHMLTEAGTFGKKRKNVVDAVAATVILEGYMAWRKNHPGAVQP